MNIEAAAEASGVSAKMIRHYEAVNLPPPPALRGNSYRDYGAQEVHELRFTPAPASSASPCRRSRYC